MAGRLVSLEHPFLRRHRTNWDDYTWGDMSVPSRIFDQNFGMELDDRDLLPPTLWRGMYLRPRVKELVPQQTGLSEVDSALRNQAQHLAALMQQQGTIQKQGKAPTTVENTEKEFKVNLDVTHFKPEEVSVKVIGNRVVIHGKHADREDEHGFIQREFKRQYILPRDVDPVMIKSSLTADGVLSLTAPKISKDDNRERVIPVEIVPETPECGEL